VRTERIEDAPFAPGSFGHIRLNHVLEHLPDPLRSLRRIRQLMAPGGSLFIEVPNADAVAAWLYGHCWLGWDVPRHLYTFNCATLKPLLALAGFTEVRLRTWPGTTSWLTSCEWRFGLAEATVWRLNRYGLLKALLNCILSPADLVRRGDLIRAWATISEYDGDVAHQIVDANGDQNRPHVRRRRANDRSDRS
jgi:SAM-dependent methyltransferase